MMLLSEAKVASKCASCGEAAKRSKGGAGAIVWVADFVGEEPDGELAVNWLAHISF